MAFLLAVGVWGAQGSAGGTGEVSISVMQAPASPRRAPVCQYGSHSWSLL